MAQDKKVAGEEPALSTSLKIQETGPGKGGSASEAPSEGKPSRRTSRRRATATSHRLYLLPRLDGDKLSIEKKYATEQEAMLDSCKLGRPYWVIEQYTASPDMSRKNLIIKRKPSDTGLHPSERPESAAPRG